MTITVPDGLVITSGIEGEDGDFVVTDTIYADNGEPCIVDTVACDTVETDFLVSADGLYNLAQQYQSEGKYIEMVMALYQSWLMGSMDEVDTFIRQHEDVKKALAFMIFMDNVSGKDKEKNLEYLNLQNPSFGRNIKAGGFYKLSVFLHYLCRNPFSLNPDGAHTAKTAHHVHRGITIA